MGLLEYPDPAALSDAAKQVYDRFTSHYSRTPLALLILGHFPAALRGFGELSNAVFTEGQLDRKTKELIFVTSSTARDCYYCAGGHSRALVEQFGMSEASVRVIRADPESAQLAEPLKTILAYARKISVDSESSDSGDVDRFHEVGLDDAAILEVTSVCMLAAAANLLSKSLHLRDDLDRFALTGYF